MDVHPIKNGIFIGIDPYPYLEILKASTTFSVLSFSVNSIYSGDSLKLAVPIICGSERKFGGGEHGVLQGDFFDSWWIQRIHITLW